MDIWPFTTFLTLVWIWEFFLIFFSLTNSIVRDRSEGLDKAFSWTVSSSPRSNFLQSSIGLCSGSPRIFLFLLVLLNTISFF
jgi:hypothetical protein